jgi:hypothetical protein
MVHASASTPDEVSSEPVSGLPPLFTTQVDQDVHVKVAEPAPSTIPAENRDLAALPALESFLDAIEMSRRPSG